jgi:hypothetical protein
MASAAEVDMPDDSEVRMPYGRLRCARSPVLPISDRTFRSIRQMDNVDARQH